MASISEKTDKNKCIIFRFRTYVGKDSNGKERVVSTTWRPPPELTKAKARKAAEIAAYFSLYETQRPWLSAQALNLLLW